MALYFSVGLVGDVDVDRLGSLSPNIRFAQQKLEVFSAETADLERLLSGLLVAGLRVGGPETLTVVDQTDYDWRTRVSGAVGAVLGPDHVQRAWNPDSDYDPRLNAPARGRLLETRPLMMREAPSGHVAGIGEEIAVSSRLARYLLDVSPAIVLGDVVLRGQTTPHWRRLVQADKCTVLARDSFLPLRRCAVSGELLRPALGVWLARREIGAVAGVAEDQEGYGYSSLTHPVVVSLSVATEIQRLFRSGFSLQPVFSAESRLAVVVRAVLSHLGSQPGP